MEEEKPYAETEAVIGKEGGIIDVKGCGVLLTIPRDALRKETNIKGTSNYTSFSKTLLPTLIHVCRSPSMSTWVPRKCLSNYNCRALRKNSTDGDGASLAGLGKTNYCYYYSYNSMLIQRTLHTINDKNNQNDKNKL